MKRTAALAALLLLAAAPQDKEKKKTHTVGRGALTPVLKLDARFDPARMAEVRIRMEAFTGSLRLKDAVPPGAVVKKGRTILTLDAAPVNRELAAAERALEVARATLEKSKADAEPAARSDALALERARTSLRDAETNLKIFDEVEGKQMLRRAEINLQYSIDSVNDQKEELAQLLEMYKSEELTNATSEIVVRRARRSLGRSKVYLEMNREEARVIREARHPQRRKGYYYSVEQARQVLQRLMIAQALSRVVRASSEAAARDAVDEQQRKVEKLRKDAAACVVRAPFDGRVFYGAYEDGAWPQAERTARTLRPGEKPSAGSVLLTVCSLETRARAALPEANYFDVALGQPVTVVPAAQPNRSLKGKVRGKATATRSSGRPYAVRVDFDEAPTDLFPGMQGKAEIRGEERRDVVLAPCKAIEGKGTERTTKVLADGKEIARKVRVGGTDGTMIEILGGLKPGDKVVLPE